MREAYLYVEGGGNRDSKAELRKGFGQFLGEVQAEARNRGVSLRIVLCGPRSETYADFRNGMRDRPGASHYLLVDAERPIRHTPRAHLSDPTEDGWNLNDAADDQCHLMAQVMETWFLADHEALRAFYGQGFPESEIASTRNLEQVAKADVEAALDRATRNTRAGKYHKTQHAPKLLSRIDPARVRARAPHCDRLFTTLLEQL